MEGFTFLCLVGVLSLEHFAFIYLIIYAGTYNTQGALL